MTYQYEPSKKERRAAAMLRERGWCVSEPTCPECHGNGFVWTVVPGNVTPITSSASSRPCSLGCPMATAFYFSTDLDTTRTTVVADGTVGMRRGVA